MKLRANAVNKAQLGDPVAIAVLEAIATTGLHTSDRKYIFMGFCPGADFQNRLDEKWMSEGICDFDFIESDQQQARFSEIMPGDTIILKKREKFGETMRLFSHGKVAEVVETGRKLKVDWHTAAETILVPLMACNSTVDMRSPENVETAMPPEFWSWLGSGEKRGGEPNGPDSN